MSRLGDILNAMVTPFGKELTMSSSSWSSGTCTITDISKYGVIMVISGDACIGVRNGTQWRFFTITGGGATEYIRHGVFDMASETSDVCTYSSSSQLTHTASGNHNAGNTGNAITKVVGLVPYWGGSQTS